MKLQVKERILKKEVSIPINGVKLKGNLAVPENAQGIVIFSHGSGSSRLSPRNNMVAEILQRNSLGTLLFDLLTEEEDRIRDNRFDIDLLTGRLVSATGWAMEQEEIENLNIGYFGASTGAASALYAAARLSSIVKAVVSRGGRPDLSLDVLDRVTSPVLLIVGGLDTEVIGMNRRAYDELAGEKELKIIPGASHLFEEPGKLSEVARLSANWFKEHLV